MPHNDCLSLPSKIYISTMISGIKPILRRNCRTILISSSSLPLCHKFPSFLQIRHLSGKKAGREAVDFGTYFDLEKTTMERIVVNEFGDSSVLKFEQDAIAPAFDKDQYLVRLHAIGVNPVETYIRSGNYGRLPALPYTPGKDGAGVIEAVGECSDPNKKPRFAVGDRVYVYGALSGSYAGLTVCDFDNAFSLPVNIKFEQGACIGIPGFTAYRALVIKANAKKGETILIHGASGGVGLFAVQIAKAMGLQVFGTASSVEGRRAVLEAGAIECFNHKEEGYINKLKAAAPNGFDVCIEMLASSNLANDLSLMAHHGRVVIVGSRGTILINPRDIMAKELMVTGVMLFSSSNEELACASLHLHDGLANGTYQPIVGLRLPLSHASKAHEEIMNGSRSYNGNIVLVPDSLY